jgi:hypothetical protein
MIVAKFVQYSTHPYSWNLGIDDSKAFNFYISSGSTPGYRIKNNNYKIRNRRQ